MDEEARAASVPRAAIEQCAQVAESDAARRQRLLDELDDRVAVREMLGEDFDCVTIRGVEAEDVVHGRDGQVESRTDAAPGRHPSIFGFSLHRRLRS